MQGLTLNTKDTHTHKMNSVLWTFFKMYFKCICIIWTDFRKMRDLCLPSDFLNLVFYFLIIFIRSNQNNHKTAENKVTLIDFLYNTN